MYLSDSIQIQWIIGYILMGMLPSFTCTHSTYWYNLLFKTGQYLLTSTYNRLHTNDFWKAFNDMDVFQTVTTITKLLISGLESNIKV